MSLPAAAPAVSFQLADRNYLFSKLDAEGGEHHKLVKFHRAARIFNPTHAKQMPCSLLLMC
jgi:hypothetical protein